MKKLLSLFLSFVMFLSVFTGISFSALAQAYGDYEYTVSNGAATITDYLGSDTVITIPSEINGYPVKEIGNYAFESCYSLTSVTIPNSVTSIETWAFCNCYNLTNVTIPNSVISIGDYAFYECDSLANVTISNNVKYIGDSIFTNLETLNYEGSVAEWITVINNSAEDRYYYPPNSNAVNFYINGELTIPSDIAEIPAYAFENCKNLTNVTIPDSVISIGDYAFYECKSLTSVTIPNSVKYIGDSIFANLNLDTLNYEGSADEWLTVIYNSAVNDYYNSPNSNTDNFYINGSVDLVTSSDITKIPATAFDNCKNLTSVTVTDSVTSIGEWSFSSCSSLTSVTISNSVKYIEDNVFNGSNLKTLSYEGTANEWLTILNNSAEDDYYYAPNLYAEAFYIKGNGILDVSSGITKIPDNAFDNCNNLTSVTIPDSVKIIGEYAFDDCNNLADIKLGNGLEALGNNAFGNTAYYNDKSKWENGALYIDKYLIEVHSNVSGKYEIKPGTRIIAEYAFPSCYDLTDVTIPDSVLIIDDYAFVGCDGLTDITIPNSVTSIGDWAFSSCNSLTSVTIGNGVKNIGRYSFEYCNNLMNITIGNNVKKIGDNAFSNTAYYNDVSKWENSVLYIDNYLIKAESDISGAYDIKSGTKTIADNAFDSCSDLTNITISKSVTSIGKYAFFACDSLKGITIPIGVKYIGDYAFDTFTGTLYYEGSASEWLTVISNSSEDEYYYPPNLNVENFYINGDLTIPSDIAEIPAYAFINCKNLTTVTIPDSVTSIGDYAFYNCSGLVSVTVPNSVKYIGSSLFSSSYINSCLKTLIYEGSADEWLTAINNSNVDENYSLPNFNAENFYINGDFTIPSDITEIPAYAFQNCKNLKSITLSNSVIRIGECAFSGCGLTEITIPDNVISIGDYAFYECNSLTSVNIPDRVTSIGNLAFGNCYNLASATIPNSVKYIGDSIFANLNLEMLNYEGSASEWLTVISNSAEDEYYYSPNSNAENFYINGDLTIPSDIAEIPANAFENCKSLTSVTIPDSVTSIGYSAFDNCSSIKNITIPNSVTSIGDRAFASCVSLTSATIPRSVKYIGDSMFNSLYLKTLYYEGSADEWLIAISNSAGDGHYYSPNTNAENFYINGDLTIKSDITEIPANAFENCKSLTSVNVPDSVTIIGYCSFSNCSSLENINIGGGVSDIYETAFMDCGKLKNIYVDSSNKNYCSINGVLFNKDKTELVAYPSGKSDNSYKIPESVQSIDNCAFLSCNSLTDIEMGNSVISIGNSAFARCSSLTEITMPNSVKSIGDNAFESCAVLTEITIPNSVTSIGDFAFWGCDDLTDVYFNGSKENWQQIEIKSGNENLIDATIHYNYSGETSITKPSAPVNFDVTGTGNQGNLLYLDWEDSANADGYRMYVVSGDKEYYKGEVTESLFKFTDLTAGWNYSLRIEAFNSAGTASTETTICAAPAPMTADDITLSTSGNKLNISWEKQTCTGYVVQWSTDSSFKNIAGTKYIDKPWNTSYSVNIADPQNYYVRVRAYKTYNGMTSYGDFSPAVKDKVLPGTITGFDIIGTGNKGSLLYLDWNGMANTDGYKVYVVSGEKEYLKGTTKDSQFKFTDLTPGWNYTVKVVAYNADGETETTTTICAAPATMTTDDFTAKASGNKLNISWDKQTCTGYVVQWSTDSSFKNITGTKYIDKPWNTSYSVSVSNPQNYYVRVRAYKTYNGMTAYGDFSPAEKAVK